MNDEDFITEIEELQACIGEPHPLVTNKLLNSMDEMARDFISRAPFAMLATTDAKGHPDVSPRGDKPGFVMIEDNDTLYLPERPGNKLAFSLKNILINPQVALIFLIPGVRESYRVHGTARLVRHPGILDKMELDGRKPGCAIQIKPTLCFLHCGFFGKTVRNLFGIVFPPSGVLLRHLLPGYVHSSFSFFLVHSFFFAHFILLTFY